MSKHCSVWMRLVEWEQSISRYNRIKNVERNLGANCRADSNANLRLSTGEHIKDITISLEFDDREPSNADGNPVDGPIGRLLYRDGANIGGWVSLRREDFSEIWEQVRQGGYAECFIDVDIKPVKFLGEAGWEWDVRNNQGIYITEASIKFVRKPLRPHLQRRRAPISHRT